MNCRMLENCITHSLTSQGKKTHTHIDTTGTGYQDASHKRIAESKVVLGQEHGTGFTSCGYDQNTFQYTYQDIFRASESICQDTNRDREVVRDKDGIETFGTHGVCQRSEHKHAKHTSCDESSNRCDACSSGRICEAMFRGSSEFRTRYSQCSDRFGISSRTVYKIISSFDE